VRWEIDKLAMLQGVPGLCDAAQLPDLHEPAPAAEVLPPAQPLHVRHLLDRRLHLRQGGPRARTAGRTIFLAILGISDNFTPAPLRQFLKRVLLREGGI